MFNRKLLCNNETNGLSITANMHCAQTYWWSSGDLMGHANGYADDTSDSSLTPNLILGYKIKRLDAGFDDTTSWFSNGGMDLHVENAPSSWQRIIVNGGVYSPHTLNRVPGTDHFVANYGSLDALRTFPPGRDFVVTITVLL